MGLGLHVIVCRRVENAGVADIGTVEIAEEVDGGAKWKDGQVLFPQESSFLGGGVFESWGELLDPKVSVFQDEATIKGLVTSLFLLTSTSSNCFSLSRSGSSIE